MQYKILPITRIPCGGVPYIGVYTRHLQILFCLGCCCVVISLWVGYTGELPTKVPLFNIMQIMGHYSSDFTILLCNYTTIALLVAVRCIAVACKYVVMCAIVVCMRYNMC